MQSSSNPSLLAAQHVQGIANGTSSNVAQAILTALSIALVGKLVWDAFGLQGKHDMTHTQRLNIERLDKRLEEFDRRRPEINPSRSIG